MLRVLIRAVVAAAFALASFAARADVLEFLVTVNTAPLASQAGFVDFQLNPGTASAPGAMAVVSDYAGAALVPGAVGTGDVGGALPAALTLGNSTPFNDWFQPVIFGTSVGFRVIFSGPFVTASSPVSTAFSFSLYDAAGTMPLLSSDPAGAVVVFDLVAGGPVSFATTYSGPAGGITITPIPEPQQLALLAAGLIAAVAIARRRRIAS